ncbi:flagellar hook-associated protein FlgK [Sphingomonas cannabina]|uniref:flagellar hook-associated protein FlgK n=1 Tax=Sphingomonas cannabina TaxID=2899123 RepID=UPI001F2A08BF|nr:flagellar hook-associated protein FlgK [Sphingomonas cannabina]UIJ45462.1 flagellar hook-associated protein FlgK [Sphingomonas cannabina]
MSDLLYIGASGVRTYQSALGTTSENIANVGTAGYARRAVQVQEIPATKGLRMSGNGSLATALTRSANEFRNTDVRTSGSDLARTEAGIVWLDRVEQVLTGNELSAQLTAFFNAAQGVAADPASVAPRGVMIESAATLANSFTATGRALDTAIGDLSLTGRDAARDLNDLAQQLYQVNQGLSRADQGSAMQMSMLDQRDRLLESMSALVDVDVTFDAQSRAIVRTGGAAGPVLVDAAGASQVSFAMSATGAAQFQLHRGASATVIPAQGGAFAGITEGAQRLADARDALNDLATRFVDGVNAVQAGGRDLDGAAGTPMFAAGDPPTEVRLVLTDPRGIAAAAPGEGTRGNSNLQNLATLRTDGKFEAGLSDTITTNAAALAARKNVAAAQNSIRDAAVAARDSVTGVDLDESAVELIRFQQAYQASSRIIQVARETLQNILDIR